ncbi:hypothetical protein BDS110ZK25_53470 [Bradyrhizobium diazoefficiens]
MVAASHAFAQTWADFATVSMTNPTTPKLTANRLCYTDGVDIACDGAAGLLTTSGTLSINTVSATNIYGSTASLTTLYVGGVAVIGGASGDRITSGTASAIANMTGGYISLTTGATTWGYLGSSATFLPIVNANTTSSTLVSTTNVSLTVSEYLSGTIASVVGYGGNSIASATTSVVASNASTGSINANIAGVNIVNIVSSGVTISGNLSGLGLEYKNTVGSSGTFSSANAACSSGKLIIGGGCSENSSGCQVYRSLPNTSTTWQCNSAQWNGSSTCTVTAYAICAKLQ